MYLVAVLEVIGEDLCQAFACAIAATACFIVVSFQIVAEQRARMSRSGPADKLVPGTRPSM